MAQHNMPGQAVRGWPRRVAAAAVAAATVVAALAGAGPAAAKPKPPALAFTPSSYDYTQVTTGQTASHTFTLANTGKRASGALRLRLAGAAAFSITGNTCSRKSLRPGKSCTVRVRFAPTNSGTVTATLTAVGKKKPAATATVALTGTGASLGAVPGHLYWTSAGGGTINVANPDGSSPRVLVSGQRGAEALAVDASHLYWTNTANGTISEANTNGSNPHVIVSGHLSMGWQLTPATSTGPPSVRA